MQDLLNAPLDETQMSENGQLQGASALVHGGITQEACAGMQYSVPGFGQPDSQFDPSFTCVPATQYTQYSSISRCQPTMPLRAVERDQEVDPYHSMP